MFDELLKENALECQKNLREAEEIFDKSFWAFMGSVVPFDYQDPILWRFVAKLVERCEKDPSVESACHNAFCYFPTGKITDAIRAVVTIAKIKEDLYEPMADFIHDRGDDGFGDLMDAFFLAGPNIVDQVLSGEFSDGDYNKVYKLTADQCSPKITAMIWNGENYFEMNLEKPAKNFFRDAQIPEVPLVITEVHKHGEHWYDF